MRERLEDRELTTADIANAANDREGTVDAHVRRVEREVDLRERQVVDDENGDMRLLPDDVANDLRPRWADIQAGFVDEPRRAVEKADALVADAVRRLTEAFAAARSDLERSWDRGDNVSTEDLRLALRRYRTFFDRLLQVEDRSVRE